MKTPAEALQAIAFSDTIEFLGGNPYIIEETTTLAKETTTLVEETTILAEKIVPLSNNTTPTGDLNNAKLLSTTEDNITPTGIVSIDEKREILIPTKEEYEKGYK